MKNSLAVFALALVLLAQTTGTAQADSWVPVPGPLGGSVADVVLSPHYAVDHTAFAGLRGQGVYRTTDGGLSWQRVSPAGWVVVDLALSPAFGSVPAPGVLDGTLFATTGHWPAGYRVQRSADGGLTWEEVMADGGSLPYPPRLALSPGFADDGTVYVLGGSQTFRSEDGGHTFAPAGGWFASHTVSALAFSPAYGQPLSCPAGACTALEIDRALFALVPGEGLNKSLDGGTTWSLTGLSGNLSTFALSPGYASEPLLLAADAGSGQVSASHDGGDTWSPVGLTLGPGGQHTLLFSPSFGPLDPVILAASSADAAPYRSDDGGQHWTAVGLYDPANVYQGGIVGGGVFALALAPAGSWDSIALAGTSSGLYRSLDRGVHWFPAKDDLARLAVRALAVAAGDPRTILAGTAFFENVRQDSGTPVASDGNVQLSTDGGQSWQSVTGRLERVQSVAFSPAFAGDGTAFAAAGTLGQHGYADGGVYRSTDGGLSWSEVLGNVICRGLALSPAFATDRTVWVSASTYSSALGLQVSKDGGNTWAPLAAAVHAQVMAPSPNYALDRTLFAGTPDNGLQRSTDGGLSWSRVLPGEITALAVSPAYGASRTVLAGLRPGALTPGEIHRSRDGGATWQRLTTGIPATMGADSLAIGSLAYAADGSLLAGVHYGNERGGGAVYRSTDGGESWSLTGGGLEAGSVVALASRPGDSLELLAGGSAGLWSLAVPPVGPAEPGTWTGGGPRGGRAQALAVSPTLPDDGLVLAGEWMTERGGGESGLGILRSVDGGESWTHAPAGTEEHAYSTALHDVAFSPAWASDGTVWAATGGGLFKSVDRGQSWEWTGRLYSGPFGSMVAVAAAPDLTASGHLLTAGGWGTLYQSRDGGLSWTGVPTVTGAAAVAYSPQFALDGTAFAGGWQGLFRTADRGLTWTGILSEEVTCLLVSPRFQEDGTLFAGGHALHISKDRGVSWSSVALPSSPFLINDLAISPAFANDHTLFAGVNEGLYRSVDGGLSWDPVTGYPGLPVRALAISPGWPGHPVLLVGTDQGVYRTVDGGSTWTRSPGLATLRTRAIALPAGDAPLVVGTFRHGLFGSDDGTSWQPLGLQQMTSYDVTAVGISPAAGSTDPSSGTMFAALASSVTIGAAVHRTTDGGASWQQVFSTDYIGGLALSPHFADDGHVYAAGGSGRVLRSTDGGEHWAQAGIWPAGSNTYARHVALPPEYPTDSRVFAAGDGFWWLPSATGTWQRAAAGLAAGKNVLSLAISPQLAADATLLAAAYWSEPGGQARSGVWRSTDGGAHWTESSTGLPAADVQTVALSARYGYDGVAYAASGQRVYRSLNGGQSWTDLGLAPGAPTVQRLAVDDDGSLYITGDEGVWRYTAPAWDRIVNGGFEADSGWDLPQTARPAAYSGRIVHSGSRAMRVGIDEGATVYAYSSARQLVAIPADALEARLRCFVYPVSGGSALSREEAVLPGGRLAEDERAGSVAAGDAQYLLLLDESGKVLARLFWELSNAQGWQERSYDLEPYAGQNVRLHFGVYNDKEGGRAAMYVDDVSLVVRRAPATVYALHLPVVMRGPGGWPQ